ncbi:MAG: hypothetical protein QF362_03275 [Candidatus Woesearchaeota archaeon]|jgi:hypothetical protein|nr:hypothetical protein [Candidatus Woesearchaeota archaeon]
MTDSKVEEQQITSRLIDHLDRVKEKINWRRSYWKDGRDYQEDDLNGKLDSDFSSSNYFTRLLSGEMSLDYHINWDNQSSYFSLKFSKWVRIGLKPKPEDIVLFSNNPYSEEKETKGHLPIFQATYHTMFTLEFKEAKVAMQDFVDNGIRFEEYFVNMQDEAMKQYFALVKRFQEFRDAEEVVRVGF